MPGASPAPAPQPGQAVYHPRTYILDHALRIVAIIPFGADPANHVNEIIRVLDSMPKLESVLNPAPVLLIPFVFEPQLCKILIEYYNNHGGEDSGFMRDVAGKTVGITDYSHKRRADCDIKDETLIRATQECVLRRIVPAIKQAYQFQVTRIERHIVACYEAETGGHFKAHRDNTTMGTAHRRFAVSINLNAEEFDGGELWFPEFSRRLYKPPTGGACIFSCSLLHEATKVTSGRRYACLPFLYDDAAAAIRDRNRQYVTGAPPKPPEASQPGPTMAST
jgi:predicted 2-oxoglutarate/Fe(II)-dependent dioxygenase YbiX